nr:probable WRKY transcription factor 63 isoform X2 [Setaria viridis]
MERVSAPGFAVSEILAKGRESAARLHAMLDQQQLPEISTMPHELQDLVEQILHCCDRALAALSGSMGKKRKPERGGPADLPSTTRSKRLRVSGGERGIRVEKKWTMEDGFAWRKYGQKNIHGSKHPRLYFRCSYNDDNGCRARRQVQQSEADPSVYIITYFDEHSCCMGTSLVGNDEKVEKFVINFGSAGIMDGELNGSPSSTCDDDGLVVCEKPDLCNSPEELQAAMDHEAAELLEQSTPVLEELGMSSPWWQPLAGGCLEWEVGHCENLFYIGESIDIDSLLQ